MSMTATIPPSAAAAAVRSDRIFYRSMAVALALTAVAGFARTYYFTPLIGGPVQTINGLPVTPTLHLHAAVFTAWLLLFIVQTTLIAGHRVRAHQRLGIAGGLLAAVMIVVGVNTAIEAAARGSAPPGIDPLAFLVVPLGDIALFATFIAAALWKRRQKEVHKRLMMLAYVSIMTAGVARLPGVLTLGPFGFYGLTFIFLAIAMVYDYASRRRVHPIYVWGGVVLVVAVPGRLMLSETGAWQSFAAFLVG